MSEYQEEKVTVTVAIEFTTTRSTVEGQVFDAEEEMRSAAILAIESAGIETNLERWRRLGAPVADDAMENLSRCAIRYAAWEVGLHSNDYGIFGHGTPDGKFLAPLISDAILGVRSRYAYAIVLALRVLAAIEEESGHGTPDDIWECFESSLHAGVNDDLWTEEMWGRWGLDCPEYP